MVDLKEFEDGDEDDEDEEKRLFFLLLLISMGSSSGKKTRKNPIPQPSLLFFAFAINPMDPLPLSPLPCFSRYVVLSLPPSLSLSLWVLSLSI